MAAAAQNGRRRHLPLLRGPMRCNTGANWPSREGNGRGPGDSANQRAAFKRTAMKGLRSGREEALAYVAAAAGAEGGKRREAEHAVIG